MKLLKIKEDDTDLQKATKHVMNYNTLHGIKLNYFSKIVNWHLDRKVCSSFQDLLVYFSLQIECGLNPYMKFIEANKNEK